MKQTIESCLPGPVVDFAGDPDNLAKAQADGAALDGTQARWCNAHIAIYRSSTCRKGDIIVDTEHPQYGTPATLVYPQDRYPWVVVGGAQSGHYLFVAPVEYHNLPMESSGTHNGFPVNDREYTSEEALANVRYAGARRITRGKDGRYQDHGTPFSVGAARYRRDWSD